MTEQVTTITFFKYASLSGKFWGFLMMQYAHSYLAKIEGLNFYRLMGSGKGKGFNPMPDWSVYSLLQVWESEACANNFFASSLLIGKYDSRVSERYTLYMKSISAAGTWVGKNPFKKGADLDPTKPIAVITRATIKWTWLFRFWKYL